MRNEETGPFFSSEQLETVKQLVGPNEPSLFSVLQQLTKKYDEKTTIHLTKEFCFLCHSDENKRVAMEYLYMNGLLDDVQKLVDLNSLSENLVNREWAHLYQFFLDRKLKGKEINCFEEFFADYKSNDPELHCLITFTKIYVHCDKYEYEFIHEYRNLLTEQFLGVSNTLLKIYFQLRENEIMFLYHWKIDEVEIAQTYAKHLIENTLINYEKKCFVVANLAETYVFDDFQMANYYIKEAKKMALAYKLDHLIDVIDNIVIPFVYAVNGRSDGISTSDKPEAAHVAVMNGEHEKAIDILSDIEELSPFQEYYLGLAKNDMELLHNAYKNMVEKKDYFFARLPLRELKKRGWNYNEEENRYVN